MTNRVPTTHLPDYETPPVVETILGVQFDRLPKLTNAHLGAFWQSLDHDEWPHVADAPPLRPQFERFVEAARWAKGIQLQLTQDPSCRLQIKNKDADRMLQVQNGRLHFNWLGEGGGDYPHYEKVREGFVSTTKQFAAFVAQENLGNLRPNQWEVTYINHMPCGGVWNTPGDWGFFQPLGSVPTIAGLVEGESFNGEWHFVIPDQRGRLHVAWQHGLKSASEQDAQEFIRLTLTARGAGGDVPSVLEGLDLGHETIVRCFRAFMSDAANKYWGLKDVGN